ncbi:MAG: hypothetical protein WCI85_16360 [Comamonadaceae bacterium]
MTRRAKPIEMPILSDETVIQIQDFLHLALDMFEDHYSPQIERFYQSIWQDAPELDIGDFPN